MTISGFVAYVKQIWANKPSTSSPLSAERLNHIEEGIKGNSDAVARIAAAVVSQIANDPEKIASMAALYAVNQKIGDTANLPGGAADVVDAIVAQNSNLGKISGSGYNTNPNTANCLSCVFNGWDSGAVNFHPDFKNRQPVLLTVWVSSAEIGKMDRDRIQVMVGHTAHCRSFSYGAWSEWA